MSRLADRALLDTNVLLSATDTGRADHQRAMAVLNEWPAEGVALYTSGQVLREYLCVATRPPADNGLGLSRSDAVANAKNIRNRLRLLEEDAKVADRLLEMLDDIDCTGKQVHDANVVATMLAHGVDALVTMNARDFQRFEGRIAILSL